MEDNSNHILKTYLRRLTSLSGNNRSLLVLRLHHEQLLDVQQLSFLNGEKAFEIVESLIADRSRKICAVLDSRREDVNEMSRKLKRLQRVDKFIFEERGSNDLHVGWPFIRGKFSDGTLVRCPLLYFPVSIRLEHDHWVLVPRNDAGITFNKSFLLAYSFYNQIQLDEALLDFSFEDFNSDSIAFRTQLYELLKDKIELNFNPDTFTDQLIPFQEFRKEEFDEVTQAGKLKLWNEAVLGIFPQAGSQLVPDYLQLIDNQSVTDLESFFSARVAESTNLRKWIASVKEEKIFAPFSLDAYQEHSLRAIKNGSSLVVQGPPGTGKSQLISNLMADAIASGKKVLLVCQKRVALDVVFDRLSKVNLGDFLGLVHDFRNDRKEIYAKIARQIDRIEDYQELNRSVDSIQTERRFFHVCRQIDQLVETLEEFRSDLFDDREAGISVKELYLTSNPNEKSISLRQEYQQFHFHTLDDFINKLRRYSKYALYFQLKNYVWSDRQSFAAFQVNDRLHIENAILEIPQFQKHLLEKLSLIAPIQLNMDELERLLQRKVQADEMLELLSTETVFQYFTAMLPERDDETSLLWLQNMERVCVNCFDEVGVEATLDSSQLMVCQEALNDRMRARKRIHKLIWWELFSKHKFFLKRVLISNQLEYTKAGLSTLEKRIDNRLNLQHHLTALKQKSWLQELPTDLQRSSLQNWFGWQTQALKAKLVFSSLRELNEVVNPSRYTLPEFRSVIQSIFSIIGAIPDKKSEWRKYLSAFQLRQLVSDEKLGQEYVITLKNDFDTLCAYDSLKQSLTSTESGVIQKLYEAVASWNADELISLFQNSIRLAWIEHIETKFPVLRSVSSFAMKEMEEDLQKLVEEKQHLVLQILLLRARERVYDNVEYNRLNNRITYRDLYHQVTKKKMIWPVRKLISEFDQELFNLLPCWLASPESVSAIFPMKEMFDLVIFDEASQCFAERGIPAMYRGKQIVIAGDDKQLKPFELYQIRWNEESENPDAEVDSLLELSERYLPTVWLQGHYRSHSLPLIDFSNQHFYEGKLKLLPHKNVMNNTEPAILFRNVQGVWEEQTNAIEANEVSACVLQLLKGNPKSEIGIIAFNAPQQMLIMDCLEQQFANEKMAIPETLFVKNIENVQGDEKDIIIFSIGYGPDPKGKMNMQFGSLNVAGGENRLNVAVTRAREKVMVIASIEPEQLNVQEVKNEGPKLLKKYLEYAREVSNGKFKLNTIPKQQQSSFWYLHAQLAQWNEADENTLSFAVNALPDADIVVMKAKESKGIILTDDSNFYSSLSVKDPFANVPSLLNQKNWSFYRVYSRKWWIERNKISSELSEFIQMIDKP